MIKDEATSYPTSSWWVPLTSFSPSQTNKRKANCWSMQRSFISNSFTISYITFPHCLLLLNFGVLGAIPINSFSERLNIRAKNKFYGIQLGLENDHPLLVGSQSKNHSP